MAGQFKKGRSANPTGKTGRRGVHYVSPGHTRVIYEDRVMDVKFKESASDYVKKVRRAKVQNPGMMYVDEQSFKAYEDKYLDAVDKRRARGAKRGSKKGVQTRKKNVRDAKAELRNEGYRIPKGATQKSIRTANAIRKEDAVKGVDAKATRDKINAVFRKERKRRTVKKSGAPQSIEDFPGAQPAPKKGRTAPRKSQFQRDLEELKRRGYALCDVDGTPFSEKNRYHVEKVREAVDVLLNPRDHPTSYIVLMDKGWVVI